MKRSVLSGLSLAAMVLSLGLVGCGGTGLDEGMPTDNTQKVMPLDPKFTDMTGRSFSDQAAMKKKADEAAKEIPKDVPAEATK